MFAVIKTGGKQYHVEKDQTLVVEKLEGNEGDTVSLDDVLMVNDGKAAKVGAPLVKGAKVEATIVKQSRAPKILVFKKKRRHNYRRKKGHRQHVTVLKIQDIKVA